MASEALLEATSYVRTTDTGAIEKPIIDPPSLLGVRQEGGGSEGLPLVAVVCWGVARGCPRRGGREGGGDAGARFPGVKAAETQLRKVADAR